MGGWRKRQIADQVDKDINDAAGLPVDKIPVVSTPVVENKDALYTIGLNQAGQTQLMLKIESGIVTLTMNSATVRQLIRLLEATLEEKQQ
jgi:hypothetical protein